MRLPSIDQLVTHASAALRRFPFTILAGILSAVIAITEDGWGIATRSGEGTDLLVATTLAIPLYFALRLAQERGVLSAAAALALRVVGAALLLAIVWFWPGWSSKGQFLHYVQLSLGLHLLVAVLPFARRGELNGFWQYNRTLFLRFLTAVLYSAVLFAGLAVAIVALENLFGIDFYDEVYLDLFVVIAFGFNTWFFVAGIPSALDALDAVEEYPRGLKLFTQFVLIPLVSVYLVILTAYLVKVLVTTEWPSGWIGWLVSSVSVVGILSILLTYPIRGRTGDQWITTYGRWFWLVMIPSIGMLLVATFKRIDQYGITEPRYFLLVLGVWLAAMAVLYGIARSPNIKLLPATLGVLAFLTFAGPWGAYAVSRASQTARLEGLLQRNGLLDDGRAVGVAVAGAGAVSPEDRAQIGAALSYLLAHHGSEGLTGLLGPELAVTDSLGSTEPVSEWLARDRARAIMAALDMEYVFPGRGWQPGMYFTFRTDPGEAVAVSGYDYVFDAGEGATVQVAGRTLEFDLDEERLEIRMLSDSVAILTVALEAAIERAIEHVGTVGPGLYKAVPPELVRIEAEGAGVRAAVLPQLMSGQRTDEGLRLNSVSATWLVSFDEAGSLDDSPPGRGEDVLSQPEGLIPRVE